MVDVFVVKSGSSGVGGAGGGFGGAGGGFGGGFGGASASAGGAINLCKAVLAFRNLFEASEIIVDEEDPDYPIALAYDFKTNTEFSPVFVSATESLINLSQSFPTTVNYFGILSKNAKDCNLSVIVEVQDYATGTYNYVGTLNSFENGVPKMLSFNGVNSAAQRITINCSSKCFIASMAIGEGVVFNRTVSVGYQPARNASVDEVSNFKTQGNDFIQGRRIKNGYQEKASINFQSYAFINTWWREFMNHVLDSKPVYFMANNQIPQNCIYGLQNPQTLIKPNYKNSHHTDIEFDINGWA